MRRKLKTHIIAVTAIIAVITVLFFLIGPDLTKKEVKGDRFIHVVSATWGANCASAINAALREQEAIALRSPGSKPVTPAPQPVTANNVFNAVNAQCADKLACELLANSTVLGVEPLKSCFKRLAVGYRCFALDRLWTLDIAQGERLTIDCHQAADKTFGRNQP